MLGSSRFGKSAVIAVWASNYSALLFHIGDTLHQLSSEYIMDRCQLSGGFVLDAVKSLESFCPFICALQMVDSQRPKDTQILNSYCNHCIYVTGSVGFLVNSEPPGYFNRYLNDGYGIES